MNTVLKTSFTVALFAVCLLGISAMTAQPALAVSCPVTLNPCPDDPNLYYVGTCQYLNWGSCEVYSTAPLGQLGATCQCDCTW